MAVNQRQKIGIVEAACLSFRTVHCEWPVGVDSILPVPLSEEEEGGLRMSADAIRQVVRSLGF